MTRNFNLIKVNRTSNKDTIDVDKFDSLSDEERREYLKDIRLEHGARIDIIKDIMKFFDFETKDNMIDISFLYNLTDKELLILHDMLYNGGKNCEKNVCN